MAASPTPEHGAGGPPALAPGHDLLLAVDTLVEGVHFDRRTPMRALGHKALAVNLSDLAAMGGEPLSWTVWMGRPAHPGAVDEDALRRGLAALARRWNCHAGEWRSEDADHLQLTVHICGQVPAGQALLRSGARPGDRIWVSGTLGGAAMVLAGCGEVDPRRLHWPEPRIELGRALRGLASAAIDVSDGLAADLGHILAASGVGASLELARIPLPAGAPAPERAWPLALGGGDDYELCFTVPGSALEAVERLAATGPVPIYEIGRIEAAPGLRILDPEGRPYPLASAGWDHFAGGHRP